MNKKIALFTLASVVIPSITSAQTGKTLSSLITLIIGYLNQFLVLLMGAAVIMFVYNVIKYFIRADAERKEAGPYVMWSLIGFFVILSMWGLVNILQNTFGLKNEYNRPASWTSFTNIFPGGSSSGGSPTSNGGVNQIPISNGGVNQYSSPIGPDGSNQYSSPIGPTK